MLQDLFSYQKDYVSSEGEILGSLKPTGNIPTFINNVITEERKAMERIFIENRMKGFEQ